MASKTLFSSTPAGLYVPAANTINASGGKAYSMSDRAALAKISMTGTLGRTFYTSEKTQLTEALGLAGKVSPEFLAKTAIFAAEKGFMKDLPALLLAKLSTVDTALQRRAFPRVIKSGKMLRNFVQIIRSGQVGRKSLGTAPKNLVRNFLNNLPDRALLNASVGDSPSLSDVIKLSHPKPPDETRKAFYGYLIDREVDKNSLPEIVKKFEAWKKDPTGDTPEVDFRLLTSATLSDKQWKDLAANSSWQTLRQGLNMFHRHNVFNDVALMKRLANKIRDEEQIRRSKVFPYQLFVAYLNADPDLPSELRNSLQDAAEIATANIPEYEGDVILLVDTSGSMQSPITGLRGAPSKMTCVQVAGLTASAILRRNPSAVIVPFDTAVHMNHGVNPKDSIMTNAQRLSQSGGGTDCASALRYVNSKGLKAKLVWYLSDNESWVNANQGRSGWYGGTSTMEEWIKFISRNPGARMVNMDITPSSTAQTIERDDIMNVGGFSDVVFDVVSAFVRGETDGQHLANIIDMVQY